MSNKTPRSTTRKNSEQRKLNAEATESPPRRRSSRLSANDENLPLNTAAQPVAVKRSMTIRKIAPRKTRVLSSSTNETVERSPKAYAKTPKTDEPTANKRVILSPILPQPPISTQSKDPQPDPVWSQKVRRSYSRLSAGDQSLESAKSPSSERQSLFGFERLQTPEVKRKPDGSKAAPQGSLSFSIGSFNMSTGEDTESQHDLPHVDPNIPGVTLAKKTTRRKRVQRIKMSELDDLAAKMNAEFAEAEHFQLIVE